MNAISPTVSLSSDVVTNPSPRPTAAGTSTATAATAVSATVSAGRTPRRTVSVELVLRELRRHRGAHARFSRGH
jgi:hypothetical protein